MSALAPDRKISEPDERLLVAVQELSRARVLDDVMRIVRQEARALTGADGVTFVLREGDQVFYADEDAMLPLWKGQRFPANACISGWAILHREPAVIEDIYADGRIPHDAYRSTFVRSLAMVPIRPEDPLGAIGAYWARQHRATATELRVLQTLANAAATTYENLRLFREIEASEERLRLALDAGSVGTWDYDAVAERVVLDARSAQMLGLAPHSPLALAEILERVHPEDRENVRSIAARAMEPGPAERIETECRVVGERDVAARGRACVDASGLRYRYIGTLRDVTDARRIERERDAALEAEIHARTAAEQANRAKDDFLAMLGHELRNPLAPIVTALDLMRMRKTVATHDKTFRIVERQVQHLTRLVDDLLDISRITRGMIELRKTKLDLLTAITGAVEQARPLIEKHAHRLRVDAPAGLTVDADPGRLTQVLANVLTNAAKFTPQGGTIDIAAMRDGADVVCRIRDTGVGMSPELLAKIFVPFVQEAQGIDRAMGGLGLGLALARRLTEMHGGTISARSDGADLGTTVEIRLPAAAPAEETPGPPAAPAMHMRVLVVDDNRDSADALREVLSLHGCEVEVAYDAPSALVVARAFRPDAALLDLGLPVMDGYELAAKLREEPELAAVPLVAFTGYGQSVDRERTRAMGFVEHLVKPVSANALTQTLEQIVRRKSA